MNSSAMVSTRRCISECRVLVNHCSVIADFVRKKEKRHEFISSLLFTSSYFLLKY